MKAQREPGTNEVLERKGQSDDCVDGSDSRSDTSSKVVQVRDNGLT